ncbi:MAG: DUF721 domain-containing protein [Rhodospirillales bacterium]
MAQDDEATKPPRRRKGGVRAVGQALSKVTAAAYGKRGFAQGDILRHWPEIAGDLLARHTLPDRIIFPRGQRTGGLLHLQAGNSAVATEVQHLKPLIVERVNTYFGYGAVRGIHIFQTPAAARGHHPRPAPGAEHSRADRAGARPESRDGPGPAPRPGRPGTGRPAAPRGRWINYGLAAHINDLAKGVDSVSGPIL